MLQLETSATNYVLGDLQASLSVALASIFRGKFCDVILPNRKPCHFDRNVVIYEAGDPARTLFFMRRGFAKVGTITPEGHEVVYDIRKSGDVMGELCASNLPRRDRAVALEDVEVIAVPFQDVMEVLRSRPELLCTLLEVFCRALSEAYEQINMLAVDDTLHRLVKMLLDLGTRVGRPLNGSVELPMYLTQEEISQMVAARRERISTALNSLRRRGALKYSSPGRMQLNIDLLKSCLC
jgi:CRP/FNR family cyclic AMP-dependent transcriptional regulator